MTDTKLFSGPVHSPGTSGDETGRAGFNLAVEHHLEFIVEATSVGDVVAAIRWAASNGRPVAVLNTGHGPTVPADGAVLINTRLMDRAEADPARRTARFGAGVCRREVIRAAAPYFGAEACEAVTFRINTTSRPRQGDLTWASS